MQKVLRRNVLARNQALGRQRREAEEKLKNEKRKIRQTRFELDRLERSNVKAERTNRREDWILGPLAPNRTAGKDGGGYGMLSLQMLHAPIVVKQERAELLNFAANDRAVVITGREKGKIGRIRIVDAERQTVTLEDVNMADMKIPPFMREQTDLKAPYLAYAIPLSIKDVRLVVPLRDKSGNIKDTIIDHLRGGRPFIDRGHGSSTPKHTRYISGLQIPIPWPKGDVLEMQAEAADTLRIAVDKRTFTASLDHYPLPVSASDELRNKYNRTRAQHTQEYVEQKMKDDAKEQWKKRRRMLLPQQEYWEHKAKQKEAQCESGMTQETWDLIREMQAVTLGNVKRRTIGSVS